jgi:hypothetical protein
VFEWQAPSNRTIVLTQSKIAMKKEIYTKVVDEVVQRMAQHADVVMNVEQVANYLGLSVGAVRKRCQRAQLPFHRNSKHLYFSKIEIDSALLGRKLITIG